jgi:hypothetical protein
MARAAIRLKCRGDVDRNDGDAASFIQASFTSVVGLMLAFQSLRLTLDARRRNSSYVTLNR